MKRALLALLAAAVLAADQITKAWVLAHIPFDASIGLLPFFSLTHVHNTGAAFGLFQGSNAILIAVTVAILFFLSYHQGGFLGESRSRSVGLALLWGGALGNLYDRVARGSVVDFLDFFWRGWHWPAFNVADSAICAGIALLTFRALFPPRRPFPGTGPAAAPFFPDRP